ncbi:hypothetical protein [Arthrobacter sp. UYCo732]|uniref:hypothetical protein n=1 Tax=Arthrobacter sp. UYCo732 TaxID=3156336 RepID=UPI003397193C
MMLVEQAVLPPIVLDQQTAISAALELASSWETQAAGLHRTADYTRTHGSSTVADRYAKRGHNLTGMAAELRAALKMTKETP